MRDIERLAETIRLAHARAYTTAFTCIVGHYEISLDLVITLVDAGHNKTPNEAVAIAYLCKHHYHRDAT